MSVKLIAFDLDGTLTQHKTKLCDEHTKMLQALSEKYKLLMVGAGQCRRIFEQMNRFPIDIIGSYGMQYAAYSDKDKDINLVYDVTQNCDKELCENGVHLICF